MSTASERAEKSRTDKFSTRRHALARSALTVIAARGFANTGLRDIAQQSDLSLGSLHYYFTNKDDLVAESVWMFKSRCARRYDDVIATAADPAELIAHVADIMAETLRDEASLHRLWYDLRNQSLFDSGFGDTIVRIDDLLRDMVWSILSRHAELAGHPCTLRPDLAYALVDGMFEHALIGFLRGDVASIDQLRGDCAALIRGSI